MARILVVDDEKSIRITLRAFLLEAHYEVGVAEDAEEALGMLAAQDFDVVLSDGSRGLFGSGNIDTSIGGGLDGIQ